MKPSFLHSWVKRRWLRRALLTGMALLGCLLISKGLALNPNKDLYEYACRSWTYQNGLPVTSVHAIAQTKDGYLWLGTPKGLVRFDGVDFALMGAPPISELRSTSVQALCPSSSGGLWFGLEKSAYGFLAPDGGWRVGKDAQAGWDWDAASILETSRKTLWVAGERAAWGSPDTLNLKRLFPDDANLVHVDSLLEDSKGRIWLGTTFHGLYYWQDGKLTKFPDPALDACIIHALAEDRQGRLWIGTQAGLLCYDANFKRLPVVFYIEVNCLLVDHAGELWAGTIGSGVARGKDGVFTWLTKADGLTSDTVLALAEDREGSVWIGTTEGLNQLAAVKFQTYGTQSGIPTALSVSVASQNTLWVGTALGAVHWHDDQATVYSTNAGLAYLYVKRVLEAKNGDVFITYGYNLIEIMHDGKSVARHVTPNMPVAMVEDAGGVIVSAGAELYRVNRERLEPYPFKGGRKPELYWIYNLSPGRDGSIWVASVNGVCRIKDGEFKQWTTADGLMDGNVRWIWEESDGTVWIGMATGIARLRNNQIQNLRKQDGLLNGDIWSIMPDDLGHLWVETKIGLCRLNKKNVEDFFSHKTTRLECTAYDGAEAVKPADNDIQECSACRTPDGRIWFPTAKGVLMVDPMNIPVNNIPPPVHVQRLRVNGLELSLTNQITVRPGRGEVEFSYAALSYIAPQKVQFRYRLEGFDHDWVEAGDRRLAFYTNLKPGRYRFQVTAANADGVWNQAGDSLILVLQPHFYQTLWFYLLNGALICVALAGLYVARVRQLKRKEQTLQQARDLLETQVQHRTTELAAANTSLLREIDEHKRTGIQLAQRTQLLENEIAERERMQLEVERIHRELVDASRQAGMAEVATSVLHNVGNVLNSVNVSTILILDTLRKSKLTNVSRLAAMIHEHRDSLVAFFTTDSRGREFPNYLARLAEHLTGEQAGLLKEVELTRNNVEHIKDIVAMQQNYAKISGVVEKVKVVDLVEDALRMNGGALVRHDVQVIRDYPAQPIEMNVERQKVLQVLVNLIRNAKYACDDGGRKDKRLTVQVRITDGRVQMAVKDNGVGIPAENLTRIFNHGFTTRQKGHGFGLHSAALAAKEMGGTLNVHSDGPGQGATFILELPLQCSAETDPSLDALEPKS